jgi:hypothetical protein
MRVGDLVLVAGDRVLVGWVNQGRDPVVFGKVFDNA